MTGPALYGALYPEARHVHSWRRNSDGPKFKAQKRRRRKALAAKTGELQNKPMSYFIILLLNSSTETHTRCGSILDQ